MASIATKNLVTESGPWPASVTKVLGSHNAAPDDRSHPQGTKRSEAPAIAPLGMTYLGAGVWRRYGGLTAIGRRGAAALRREPPPLRGAKRASAQSVGLDCFASLAMTENRRKPPSTALRAIPSRFAGEDNPYLSFAASATAAANLSIRRALSPKSWRPTRETERMSIRVCVAEGFTRMARSDGKPITSEPAIASI